MKLRNFARLIAHIEQQPSVACYMPRYATDWRPNVGQCGTAYCVAGHATILKHPEREMDEVVSTAYGTGRQFLGLTQAQATRLFCTMPHDAVTDHKAWMLRKLRTWLTKERNRRASAG